MVEIIYKVIKLIAALSLQLLSFSLLFWAFSLEPHFSALHIIYAIGICLLVYLFVSYSLALFKQVFQRRIKPGSPGVLDEDEILKHKKYD